MHGNLDSLYLTNLEIKRFFSDKHSHLKFSLEWHIRWRERRAIYLSIAFEIPSKNLPSFLYRQRQGKVGIKHSMQHRGLKTSSFNHKLMHDSERITAKSVAFVINVTTRPLKRQNKRADANNCVTPSEEMLLSVERKTPTPSCVFLCMMMHSVPLIVQRIPLFVRQSSNIMSR